MKYLNLLFILLFAYGCAMGQSDAIDKYFAKYQNDDRFTMVHVSPKMFEMIAKVAPEDLDQELKDMISKLKGLKVLKSDVNVDELYNEAIKTINTNDYEELMTIRGGGKDENVKILVKDSQNGDIINELLLLVGGDEFVMLSVVGEIDLKTISRLAKNIDIDGMEHLKNLDDPKKNNDR